MAGITHPKSASPAGSAAEREQWVQQTFVGMSLDEKIGQLIVVACYGGFCPIEGQEFQRLARQVEENHVGGLIIANRRGALGIERSQVYPTAALVNALQRRARIPLLASADFERGTAMRLQEGTSFPEAMAVAATGRVEDAYEMGKITALEAHACGVPWIFAPVCDVNSNPANPIINFRSFGEDPTRVGVLAAAFVRGVQENGGLATAKHFPGHGDTDVDSHLELPTVKANRERLDRVEFPPFRAAIEAGAGAVMTGHLAVPALEPDGNAATLSRKIVTDTLRRELGFEGLVVTDDLDMGGVTARYAPGEIAVRAILAGSDVLLAPPEPGVALAALLQAAHSERLPAARIDEAVLRILRAKARLGLHRSKGIDLEALGTSFARPEYAHAAQQIANRGVTLLRDQAKLLPLDAAKPLRVLLVALAGDPARMPAEDFENELRRHVDELQAVRCDTRFNTVDRLKLPAADSYDIMIVALVVRYADRKGSVSLPVEQMAAVRGLLASGKPLVVVCIGNPYLIDQFPEAGTWLAVFGVSDVAQRATARAMFGEFAIAGKIPVSVPGVIGAGGGIEVAANPMRLMSSERLESVLAPAYLVLEEAVRSGAFPGCSLAVGSHGQLAVRAIGKLHIDADAPPVTAQTIYDAASLTKPVVTTTLAAMLSESRQLDLTAPIARYLPAWIEGANPEWRKSVTVRHLLTHTSGLPAYRKYFASVKNREELLVCALSEPLDAPPGAKTVYSDIGFILLGEILERLIGRPLDRAAQERIFVPLGMTRSMFNPSSSLHAELAPTEKDIAFRQRLIRGEVHDENCYVMGGASGHAGMFSTAGDLAIFCQMMLNGGIYAHRRLLKRETVAQFTALDPWAAKARTLGWDVPSENSSSGRYFSPRSYGHLGFTGTSIWIDPEKELFVVLLTNRVHPTRENDKIQRVRPALHNSVIEALGLAPADAMKSAGRKS